MKATVSGPEGVAIQALSGLAVVMMGPWVASSGDTGRGLAVMTWSCGKKGILFVMHGGLAEMVIAKARLVCEKNCTGLDLVHLRCFAQDFNWVHLGC